MSRIHAKLDFISFAVAGMRDGAGPLLTVFLIQNTHWSPQELSWILAAPGMINMLAQIPIGVAFDKAKHQNWLIALGGVLMAGAAFGISQVPSFALTFAVQLVTGMACCLISVGVPALTLTTVSAADFGPRLARNEVFSKIGNFGAIAVTGYIAQKFNLHSIFYVVYCLAFILMTSALAVDKSELITRSVDNPTYALPFRTSLANVLRQTLFIKMVCISFIYQFANSSLLLIFEQSFVRQQNNGGAGILAGALFATQIVIIIGCLALARWTKQVEPIKLLGFGFIMIIIRSLAFVCHLGLVSLSVAQLLDGCIAAILIIVPIRALASLNDENFNVMSGVLGTCVVLGATLSTLLSGVLIAALGFNAAFIAFAGAAFIGALITWSIRQAKNSE